MKNAAILSLQSLSKSFGAFSAVDSLSFEVNRGEIFGFLGPNGAGKTTTLRMVLDIIQPSAGAIEILGSKSAIPVRHRIGYLPEERGLYRKMRAAETIAYFAQLRGMDGRAAHRRALELLERFGLRDFARSKNEALSKGMAQKVQLLATIAHDPELLILDEPFSGLDPINQAVLENLIVDLKREGRTIIFSTHVMQHAERLCDRFLILAHGRKRFEGNMAAARAAFPHRLVLRTADSLESLRLAPGVEEIVPLGDQDGGEMDYELLLARGAEPQRLLQAAFEAGIRLSRFDYAQASLHDIFVALAGEEEQAPQKRGEEQAA